MKYLDKLDDWFCEGWRQCWRWFSVQMHLIATALMFLASNVGALPPDLVRLVPQPWTNLVLGAWAFLGLIARLKRQPPPAPKPGVRP